MQLQSGSTEELVTVDHHHLPLSLRAAVNSAWRRPLRCPQLGGCFLLSWRGGAAVRHRGVQHSAQSFSPQRLLEKCERHCHTWLRSRYSFLSLSILPSLGGMQRNSEKRPPFSVHVLWRQIVCVGRYLIFVYRKNLQINIKNGKRLQISNIIIFFCLVKFSSPQCLFSSQMYKFLRRQLRSKCRDILILVLSCLIT